MSSNIFMAFSLCLVLLSSCSKETPISIPVPVPSVINFDFSMLSTLPMALEEGSGLEITEGTLWSFNDNSGKDRLYQFDLTGKLLKTLNIDAKQEDWEDIAQDDAGNLYLGDFGNNDNKRRNLKIYQITPADLVSTAKVKPNTINFTLEDQSQFPPQESQLHFDIEAMFAMGNQLYLLTKDRSKPFVGKTKLYQLSQESGTQIAALVSEFKTDTKKAKGAITAADISPDGTKLALLSNEVVWVFSDFTGTAFFDGTVARFDLPVEKQMEGIVFQDDCSLFLLNEGKSNQPGDLHQIGICN